MADNHSFDVVSEINHAEMHNAVVQAQHEIAVRFDFKGTRAVDRVQQEGKPADHPGRSQGPARNRPPDAQGKDGSAECARRCTEAGQDRGCHARYRARDTRRLHTGIETDDARKIVKDIKQLKIKVQAQIMDDKVRVTGKKLDDLQAVIAHLKAHGPEYPLQFVNLT